MDTTFDTTAAPIARAWTGRILTAIPVLFLTFDALFKLVAPGIVAEASVRLGLPANLAIPLGLLLACCVALYVVRRTAPLGAVLLTGYLGGAVLTHLRIGDPMLSHTLFPVYIGALLWAGLYLRDARVHRLFANP
jgi:hypothetical protein